MYDFSRYNPFDETLLHYYTNSLKFNFKYPQREFLAIVLFYIFPAHYHVISMWSACKRCQFAQGFAGNQQIATWSLFRCIGFHPTRVSMHFQVRKKGKQRPFYVDQTSWQQHCWKFPGVTNCRKDSYNWTFFIVIWRAKRCIFCPRQVAELVGRKLVCFCVRIRCKSWCCSEGKIIF